LETLDCGGKLLARANFQYGWNLSVLVPVAWQDVIHKEAKSVPGFKTFKDRIWVLHGGNVAGYKLKPFVIWHSENPKALKHISKHSASVLQEQ
jgi:hypothetical protein